MDPPTYPFEETSFMDGPLLENLMITKNEPYSHVNPLFSKTLEFYFIPTVILAGN